VDGQDKAVNGGSRAERVLFLDGVLPTCARLPKLGAVDLVMWLLLHSPPAMFLREFSSACESLIAHRPFRSKQGFIADRVK